VSRPGLGKHHVPEIGLRDREAHSNESPLLFLADGGHETLHRFRSHFIENADRLAGQQGSIHYNKCPVGADVLSKSLQVNSFAFRHLTANFQGYLKCYADRATPLWMSGSMHSSALGETRPWELAMIA